MARINEMLHREPIPVLNYDKDYWQISQLGRGNSMSTTFEIIRFAKPSKKELQMLDYFSEYDSFRVVDFDGMIPVSTYDCSERTTSCLAILSEVVLHKE